VQKIECAIALCAFIKISCFLSECTLVSPGNVFVAPDDGRFGDWLLYIWAQANHLVADEIHDWQRFATPPRLDSISRSRETNVNLQRHFLSIQSLILLHPILIVLKTNISLYKICP
jgi:hypothetical protein